MTNELPRNELTTQSCKASSPRVDEAERAAAAMCKRIAAGFGVADHSKFAAFSAEVFRACKNFAASEIAEAADTLMRSTMRPNIGEVYRALSAAGRRADLHEKAQRPMLTPPARKGITADEIAAIKRRVDQKFAQTPPDTGR